MTDSASDLFINVAPKAWKKNLARAGVEHEPEPIFNQNDFILTVM